MNRTQRKYQQKQEERRATKADTRHREWNDWIEKLYAAYLTDTKIPASRATLCHEKTEVEEGKVVDRYWFEHHDDRVQIVDTHPDIQYLFELASEIDRAYVEFKGDVDEEDTLDSYKTLFEPTIEGLDTLREFMNKYKEVTENEIPGLKKLEDRAHGE